MKTSYTIAIFTFLNAAALLIDAASIPCDDEITPSSPTEQFKNALGIPKAASDTTEIPITSTTSTTGTPSFSEGIGDMKKLLSKVQCTLERAKPIVAEIEKEAKRLEASAKRFGERVISRFGDFMDKIIVGNDGSGGVKSLWKSLLGVGSGSVGGGSLGGGSFGDGSFGDGSLVGSAIGDSHVTTDKPNSDHSTIADVTIKTTEQNKEKLTTAMPPIDDISVEADLIDNEIPSDGDVKKQLV